MLAASKIANFEFFDEDSFEHRTGHSEAIGTHAESGVEIAVHAADSGCNRRGLACPLGPEYVAIEFCFPGAHSDRGQPGRRRGSTSADPKGQTN